MSRRRKLPVLSGDELLAILAAIAVYGAAPVGDILAEVNAQGRPLTREGLERALRQLERLVDEDILETSIAVICGDLHRKGHRPDPIDERPYQWPSWRGM